MKSKVLFSAGCLYIAVQGAGLANNRPHVDDTINIEFFDPAEKPADEEPALHMVIYQESSENAEEGEDEAMPASPAEDISADLYLESGFRHDDIHWNKAHPSGTPNILSALSWNDLEIAVFEVGTRMTVFNDWVIEGKAAYGEIFAGKNQDSDYFGNDRTLEFSRSNNSANSGSTLDLSLGLGYRFNVGKSWLHLTPKAGFSYHAQNLDTTDGFQTIPASGSFPGLDSSYDTSWYGPWVSLEATIDFSERLDLTTSIEYHSIKYEATANWNLRGDLQHPESFKHKAYGEGVVASAKTGYAISPEWKVNLSADYQSWSADEDGRDHMFFSDGSEAQMQLNEVNWDSYGFNLGIEYAF